MNDNLDNDDIFLNKFIVAALKLIYVRVNTEYGLHMYVAIVPKNILVINYLLPAL